MNKKEKKGRLVKVLAVITLIVVIALLLVFAMYSIHYSRRWYPGTIINGVDVSGQTLEASKKRLLEEKKDYRLVVLAREEGKLEIDGAAIGYSFGIGKNFDETYSQQHKKLAVLYKKQTYDLPYDVSYEEDKLSEILKESELLSGSEDYSIKKPKSAYVDFSEEDKKFICVPEYPGTKLKKKAFETAVKEALSQALAQIDLSDDSAYPDVYESPKITSDDEELNREADAYNQTALRYISWNMGEGVTEKITPKTIAKWISYQDGEIQYDENAVADWVEAFCLKYKTVGKNRLVKVHTGKRVEIKGGDYGWQMDYQKTLEQAKAGLKQELEEDAIKNYMEDPSSENKKKITIKKKVTYLNTAFQKDYENFAVDWDTENYTEVSIKDQMVYVFRKGKVAFKCKCITGRPVEGRATPKGAYFIKEHREAYTLTGADYKTPVVNWVRITWTGTGFHPATWQPWSRWTKDLYKTRGSHGCVNLSPDDAAKIYELTSYREAVFIY